MLVTGCGAPGGEGGVTRPGAGGATGQTPDAPVSSTPGSGRSGKKSGAISPSKGLVDVRRQPWERAQVLKGGKALKITFYGGVEECYGLDRYDVAYKADRIVVTLFAGAKRGVDVCIEMAQRFRLTIPLKEPVEGRAIVDGA